MGRSIISVILLCGWAALASAATTADLSDTAPDRYVVVKGDTLWGISGRFLKSPWKWPELWRMNREQIKNPNRIYPGDVLILDRSAIALRLQRERAPIVKLSPQVRTEPLASEAVPVISTADIEPFLSKPLVIQQNQLASAPRIVRTQENRVALGAGNVAYVQGITQDQGQFWELFRPGAALIDPDTNETLGYEAIYLGEARVTRYGEATTIEITKSPLEIYAGDYLLPASRVATFDNFVPHAPSQKIDARIISAYGGLYEVGGNAIVSINKGTRDGLEVGHVLAIYRDLNTSNVPLRESSLYGRTGFTHSTKAPTTSESSALRTRDTPLYGRLGPFGARYKDNKDNLPAASLPAERYGLLMVFRVFERASYALIMNSDRPVNVLDVATNP